jgi:hypothetical protein
VWFLLWAVALPGQLTRSPDHKQNNLDRKKVFALVQAQDQVFDWIAPGFTRRYLPVKLYFTASVIIVKCHRGLCPPPISKAGL